MNPSDSPDLDLAAEDSALAPSDAQTASDTRSPVEADANSGQYERENLIDTPPQNDDALLPVVGLGGSAGSIRALQEFFGRIPTDLGVAYVVVVHLSPDFESQLSQILQTRTKMPVVQVQDSVAVEANHVYVIPPAHHLSIEDGHIHLTPPQQDRGKRVVVDLFFRTLATARRSKAVAIVLSGTDGDGAIGIKRIKEHGGVTIAQSPDEAEHSGMPRSAIETGMVDWTLTVEQMAEKLTEWIGNERRIHLPSSEGPLLRGEPGEDPARSPTSDADEAALRETLGFLQLTTGHDFSHYKRATVLRRIMRRLQVNSLQSLPQYAEWLRTHPGEAGALLQDLLISVTNFFRDPEAFVALGAQLPGLFRGVKDGEALRVWVPGCATGEEAYSLAILLAEYADTLTNPPQVQIFATDLDEPALKTAREGTYPATIHADVSPERLRRFFVFDQGHYRVKKEVRERVLFAPHNLLRDSPFSRLDLVSCRNLLIYFVRRSQDKVLDVFHFALKPDAVLFLGSSESADESRFFRSEDKKFRIYRRQIASRSGFPFPNLAPPLPPRAVFRPARPLLSLSAPILATELAKLRPEAAISQRESEILEVEGEGEGEVVGSEAEMSGSHRDMSGSGAATSSSGIAASFGALHLRLLEQSAPPSVLVNADYEIVHLSARAGGFLRLVGGEVSTNLLSMVHPALRLELRAALFRAVQSGENSEVAPTAIEIDGKRRSVGARVRPMREDEGLGARGTFVLVIFDEVASDADGDVNGGAIAIASPAAPDSVARQLDGELQHLKAVLRANVEQYEASSEELRASNEELLAMNEEQHAAGEELETSREEISAANEELTTVNSELKSNNEELSRINDDLRNLIGSTDIATVFLSRDGCIKRYTPRAVELFRMIPGDIGRPLADLHHPFATEFLAEAARTLLSTLSTQEREVQTLDGRWFLCRLSPYRTLKDRIDGVVISFVDITESKRTEATRTFLASIIESSQDSILSVDFEGQISSWNRAAEELYGYEASEVMGKPLALLTLPEDLREVLGQIEKVKQREVVEIYDTILAHKNGHQMNLEVVLSPVKDAEGQVIGVSTIARDVTERRLAREARREIEERYSTLFNTIDEGFVLGDAVRRADGKTDFRFEEVNPAYCRLIGVAREAIVGRTAREVIPQIEEGWFDAIASVMETGRSVRLELEAVPIGRWLSAYFSLAGDSSGSKMAIVFSDITERVEAMGLLSKSETRLRAMFEQASVGIVQTDLSGRLMMPNPGFCAIIGYSRGETEALTLREVNHPDGYEREMELLRQIFSGEIPGFSLEKRYIRKDGGVVWGQMSTTLVKDAEGEPLYALAVVEDITARKLAQEAVRESEERLSILIESVGDYAIFTLDAEGIVDSWNSGAERIFGYTATEIRGQSGARLFTPEDRAAGVPEAELGTAEREGHAADERWHLRKDGTNFYESGVTTPLRRGPRRGFVKVARDLTEQKRAENLLREGEARIRTLSDAIPQLIWTNRPDGWADYFNRRWYEFSGLTFEESAGRGWEAIVHPDDAWPSTQKWRQALDAGVPFEVEYRLRRADGVYCWQIGRNLPLRDEEDRIIGWFGTSTDIQDLKGAQEALGKARDELEWRVEERTRDLGQALERLRGEIGERKKIEAARRDLLKRLVNSQEEERGRISRELHDNLGQHLTAVMLGLKTLESQTQAAHRDAAMQASFETLSGLVDALMQAAHRQAWELRPAELDDMGLEVALRHYVSDWGKRTAIPVDFHANGWDRERLDPALEIVLYRVVQEALTNVSRHSGATGASVILERSAAGVSAIIEDNGSGFSPAPDQGRLGLLGMRERLALVGGTLEIESTPGEATTLFARVPNLPPPDADLTELKGDPKGDPR